MTDILEAIPTIDLEASAPTIVEHPEIDNLVAKFSNVLRSKLISAEEKYKWNNGWLKDDWKNDLIDQMHVHIEKGDPRDVAVYCAFAWYHGWSLKKAKNVTAKEDVQHYDLMTIRPYLKTMNARLTRKRYAETTMKEYLQQIQPTELAEQYLEFYNAHPLYKDVCAGAKHHHWWKGGLEQHVCEMIGVGMDMMDLYPGDMIFTKSDLIIACFLHDFNKIWIYRELTQEEKVNNPKKYHEKQVFGYQPAGRSEIIDGYSMILLELAKAGIVPSDIQWSAVLFHESAFSPAGWSYAGPSRTMDTVNTRNQLAVLVNMVDTYSAHFLGRSLV